MVGVAVLVGVLVAVGVDVGVLVGVALGVGEDVRVGDGVGLGVASAVNEMTRRAAVVAPPSLLRTVLRPKALPVPCRMSDILFPDCQLL